MRYLTPILAIAALTGAALFDAQQAPAAHAATTSPAHAAAPSFYCLSSCLLGLNYRNVNAKYNNTNGLWRVAAAGTWTTVTLAGGSTVEIQNDVNGGCMNWLNGTGMIDGQCGLARSNWVTNTSCGYGTTLTNVYAKSLGDDDVLSAGAVGVSLNMAPDGRCAADTGWYTTASP